MVMCSKCHKRMATVFLTKTENGQRVTEGLCMKCAKEMGLPTDQMMGNVMGSLGISPEQMQNMEEDIRGLINQVGGVPSDNDDNEDGGAPAIDFPALFRESGLFGNNSPKEGEDSHTKEQKTNEKNAPKAKKYKFLDTYCRNLTERAAEGKLDRIVGRERELARMIQILCRRQKNNPCLIGEPGVGKTAIAEALAQRISENNVP